MTGQIKIKEHGIHRSDRMLKPFEFKQVFSKPVVKSGDDALLFLLAKNGFAHSRLGLAISKKNIKKAVGRNRIKRLLREYFRQNKQILVGYDIVVVSRREISQLSNREIVDRLKKHWSRLESKCARS